MELQLETVSQGEWEKLDSCGSRTIFQTRPWMEFVARTQDATPILARVRVHDQTVGFFSGLIIRRLGFRILGSPFPGWTTSYMGFNLRLDVPRRDAMRALVQYVFGELGCHHFEIMDRSMTLEDCSGLGLEYRMLRGFEIDLTCSDEQLLARMTSACRRCIHKAEKCGVSIEEASDLEFADDYYTQLKDVFDRQSLIPTYPIERVRELIKQVYPTGMLLLLRARDNIGRCIATGIFPAMNDCMYFWGGASWRTHQISRPNEAIQWYAMKYWKRRGILRYDMGGDGEYKRKYGGRDIAVPWFRKSRNTLISNMRDIARQLHMYRRHFQGWLRSSNQPESL